MQRKRNHKGQHKVCVWKAGGGEAGSVCVCVSACKVMVTEGGSDASLFCLTKL